MRGRRRWSPRGCGESTLDLGLGLRYRTRFAWLRNTAVTFQLNVINLLDATDPVIRRATTPKRIVTPGAPPPTIPRDGSMFVQYFLREARTWNLSARFQF